MWRRDSKRQLKGKDWSNGWLGIRHLTYPTTFNFSLAFKATDGICCSKISASLIQKAADMVFFSFVYWSQIFVCLLFSSLPQRDIIGSFNRTQSATFCRIFSLASIFVDRMQIIMSNRLLFDERKRKLRIRCVVYLFFVSPIKKNITIHPSIIGASLIICMKCTVNNVSEWMVVV